MACLSIILKKILNRVGARMQPCFTPLAIGKGSERSLFNLTWLCWSSCSWMTILRIFGGQPRRYMISQRPFLLTVSNALVRSTNVTYSTVLLSTLLLELPEDEGHVCSSPVCSEATLGFWEVVFCNDRY